MRRFRIWSGKTTRKIKRMSSRRLRAYLLLIIAAGIWGVAGPVIKFTLEGISPISFLTYRFGISTVIALGLFARKKIKLPRSKGLLGMLFLNGLLGNTIALGLLFWGLTKTTVLDMSIIEATAPLITAAAGAILLKEHVTKKEKIGILIAFLGTLIMIVGPLAENKLAGGVFDFERMLGNTFVFLFVLTDAYSFILAKQIIRKRVSAETIANSAFVVAFMTMVPMMLWQEGWGNFGKSVIGLSLPHQMGVFYMAIISGTIGYTLWNMGQKTIEVSEAVVFRYLLPVFATPLAIFWLGEKMSWHFVIGAMVIGVGVIIAEHKKRRKKLQES
jgi:drug/metabolite transporter (DMT)-like permease